MLNNDVLYLIFEEVQDNAKTLYSCLLVNKTWSEIIITILWKDPWKYLTKKQEKKGYKKKLLLNVIISHLSEESKNNLKIHEICPWKKSYQKPLFDYIRFCKHLNLIAINRIITTINSKPKKTILLNEILKLFINGNTKVTHLYLPRQFDCQIHLIPGAKQCFSEIKFLSFNTKLDDNILTGLIEICKSIKEFEFFISIRNNNHRVTKLIETQKCLLNIRFQTSKNHDKSFCKILENSWIKHANTIQSLTTNRTFITNILSSFVNLKILELAGNDPRENWNCLMNLRLPSLRILRSTYVSTMALISLIENTGGHLIEINIGNFFVHDFYNKRLIQIIYKNCPNLKYLRLVLRSSNILEFEKLLIHCQHLDGLSIWYEDRLNWDNLFEILIKSSPTNLFKFKFYFSIAPELKSFESFFDNWKGRHPMLLQICLLLDLKKILDYNFIKKYKVEGIIKKFDFCYYKDFEVLEW
ncbi:hypothetical protein C1645_879587 [Glomus cerebriforme]|uniref:F-box domain-containing protein n=1 Tax=Glomus cerebriforme TaxID=658196 RepID=A0A397SHF6_9GLOM|nr:hypothetical protein C1645_879587 [Glomus cerebriforme]